ncbi:hypothetical protein GGR52DRAFT_271819 [Hypoxylon sp. FL1284]|nr:hypothetical protein GGR52DRAFT_271819 [Hypoxylon sp. FL1284]
MLRRPPTTLTLTAEDVAAYEDRRFSSQAQTHSPEPHATHQTAMDTSSSSSSSPPQHETGDDEDMRDAGEEDEDEKQEEELEATEPFATGVAGPRRSAREQLHQRPQSPGQARAAYLQQVRATRRQQQQQQQPTATATGQTRMQRITGAAAPGASRTAGHGTATRAAGAASRQGSTEPSAPAQTQGRMMTRSREERIGVAGPNTGAPARRR